MVTPKHYNGFILADDMILNFKVENVNIGISNVLVTNVEDSKIDLGESRSLDIVANPYEFNIIM